MKLLLMLLIAACAWGQPNLSSYVTDNISHSSARVSFVSDTSTRFVVRHGATSGGPYTLRTQHTDATTLPIMQITGATCAVTWYWRAYTTNNTTTETDDVAVGAQQSFSTSACVTHPVIPTLPAALPADVTYAPPTSFSQTFTAATCNDIQTEVNNAFGGATNGNNNYRVVTPASDCTSTATLNIPNKTGSGGNPNGTGEVVIGPDLTKLPPIGGRMISTYFGQHTTRWTRINNTGSVVAVNASAKGVRFVGFTFKPDSGLASYAWPIIDTNGATKVIVDRCYIHSNGVTPAAGLRGLSANGTNILILNSEIYIMNSATVFGIAIGIDGGSGWVIYNNKISSRGIPIYFNNSNNDPNNMLFSRNLMHVGSEFLATALVHRQAFEIKQGRIIHIDGNDWVGWANGEQPTGEQLIFVSAARVSGQSDPGTTIADITISNNRFRRIAGGINIDYFNNTGDAPSPNKRFAVLNNLWEHIDGTFVCGDPYCQQGRGLLFRPSGIEDLYVDHNTVYKVTGQGESMFRMQRNPMEGLVVTNNILPAADTNALGVLSYTSNGNNLLSPDGTTDLGPLTYAARITAWAKPSFVWTNNVHPADGTTVTTATLLTNMPSVASNNFPGNGSAGREAIKFAGGTAADGSERAQNFCISEFTSPYRGSGNDGRQIGVNCVKLLEGLGGTYGLSVHAITSSGGTIGFNAPAGKAPIQQACTVLASTNDFATFVTGEATVNTFIPWYQTRTFTGLASASAAKALVFCSGTPGEISLSTRS